MKNQVDFVVNIFIKNAAAAKYRPTLKPFEKEVLSEYTPMGFVTNTLAILAIIFITCTRETDNSKSFVLNMPRKPMEKYLAISHKEVSMITL